MKLEKADADIKIAKLSISPEGNPNNDEEMISLSAYHVQQGIEKLLKILLKDVYGMDDSLRKFRTHDITALIDMLERDFGYYGIPEYIQAHSIEITEWEMESRYGEDLVVTKEEINRVIECYYVLRKSVEEKCKSLHNED